MTFLVRGLALPVAALMLVSLTACGGDEDDEAGDGADTAAAAEAAVEAADATACRSAVLVDASLDGARKAVRQGYFYPEYEQQYTEAIASVSASLGGIAPEGDDEGSAPEAESDSPSAAASPSSSPAPPIALADDEVIAAVTDLVRAWSGTRAVIVQFADASSFQGNLVAKRVAAEGAAFTGLAAACNG